MALGTYQKLDQNPGDIDLEAAHSPPAYDAPLPRSITGSSPNPASAGPIPGPSTSISATNFISVIHENTKITGAYTIDTSVAAVPIGRLFPPGTAGAPSSSSPQQASNPSKENGYFRANHGNIELDLRVKGGKKADIRVESENGHVWVNFPQREQSTPLQIYIKGQTDTRVSLPASFRGPVAGGSKQNGPIQFSPAIKDLGVSTFSVNQSNPLEAKYFVGQWDGSGGLESDWGGDRLIILSERGDVLVQTYEEREAEDKAAREKLEEWKLGRKDWGSRVTISFGNIFVAVWGVIVATALFIVALFNLD
ncbi:hypothetical protein HWV62_13060 [Athelia sp. TMB]|nr:hypothetical protein HWV62_13060 [Athelia sp. TMB]